MEQSPGHEKNQDDGFNRREFVQWLGSITALLSLDSCTRPPLGKTIPYSRMPEEIIPGVPLFYATAMPFDGYGMGALVESHTGRPTKIEGNPSHSSSFGASDTFMQASILDLYDPDRSQALHHRSTVSTWSRFSASLRQAVQESEAAGLSVRVLTGTVTSPTLAARLQTWIQSHPTARWHRYQPVNRDQAREGSRLAFGRFLDLQYRFADADVVVSFDDDFLGNGPGKLRYTREFTSRRHPESRVTPNRLYFLEASPTLAGAVADHRLPCRPGLLPHYLLHLARMLDIPAGEAPALNPTHARWLSTAAGDLLAHPGRSLVLVGESLPPPFHALAHQINQRLGNSGKTVWLTDPVEADPVLHRDSLGALVQDMQSGKVGVLLALGGNPAYNAPADLNFDRALQKVKFRAHLGLYRDETSELCDWHIPEAHYLESWGDLASDDGTITIQQPLIAPLYQGKSVLELVACLAGDATANSYDLVKGYWKDVQGGAGFEKQWQRWLHDGVVAGTAMRGPAKVALRSVGVGKLTAPPAGMDLLFRPDPNIWDGQFNNNGWLQELPKPFTKLTWDNGALVSPHTASSHGLKNGDVIEITLGNQKLGVPVWVVPGQPDDTLTLPLGYGRKRSGSLGNGRGFNAYTLRPAAAPWVVSGVTPRKTGGTFNLVCTHGHQSMEGRELVKTADWTEYFKKPRVMEESFGKEYQPSIPVNPESFPPFQDDRYQWGMNINLGTCTGCNACVVACQSENNIPIVGKDEVERQREMHWLRIDTYYEGNLENPAVDFQPVPCMHCETAPCEVVCPVDATSHSHEGLNQMTYNRCVGTRYCSNNCPYKVRRFNFYHYNDPVPVLQLRQNPNVTVRARGVMEKCSYCVQRINSVRIDAEKDGRTIRDGEIRTACQQACPAQAIVFGNVKDPASQVSALKANPLNYGLLPELNTRPRTTYLAKLKNPNPELRGSSS